MEACEERGALQWVVFEAGVSQREVSQHFPALLGAQERYLDLLSTFFEEHLQSRFREPDYAFDVYVTSAGKVNVRV